MSRAVLQYLENKALTSSPETQELWGHLHKLYQRRCDASFFSSSPLLPFSNHLMPLQLLFVSTHQLDDVFLPMPLLLLAAVAIDQNERLFL